MGLKTWMVLLWILLFFKGVSFADNCSGQKNIMVFPGEAIILDIDEDEVKDNTLIDGNGKDIARIENRKLTIIDERYKDNLTAKGFSFHIKSTAIEGKKNFTASVLYTNGSHCSQHYIVTVKGGEICSEIKKRIYIFHHYFTLDFDAPGVENITWLFGSNRTIAITKDKAKLQILDSNYEGSLSVVNASLLKHYASKEDIGDYTARVIFRNGTWCQQHYSIDQGVLYILEHVSAAEGGDVILRFPRSECPLIIWGLLPRNTFIATTELGNPIHETSISKEYRGRVSSEADGSLHIYNLSLKDQGVYGAQSIDHRIFVEFNLTVYENLSPGDIKINHNLTRNDTCSLSLLCTVDKQDVTITWSIAQSCHINVTGGVLYVPPSDVNLTYTCTARNPVSIVSKSVIPGEFCRRDLSEVKQPSG